MDKVIFTLSIPFLLSGCVTVSVGGKADSGAKTEIKDLLVIEDEKKLSVFTNELKEEMK